MSNKSISESTLSELIERKKKHQFFINLIDAEIAKRKGNVQSNKTIAIKKSITVKPQITKKTSPKKASTTRDDMKTILKRKGIDFKSSDSKADLLEIVRKHNLVRTVDDYHKERCTA